MKTLLESAIEPQKECAYAVIRRGNDVNMTRAAGNDGEIQFNQCGSLGADSKLTWDRTNSQLNVQKSAQITGDSVGNQLSVNCNLQTDHAVGIQGSCIVSDVTHTGSNSAGVSRIGTNTCKNASHTYKVVVIAKSENPPSSGIWQVTVQRWFDGSLEGTAVHTVINGISSSPTIFFNSCGFGYVTSIYASEIVVNDYWEWQVDVLNPLLAVNCDSSPVVNIINSGIVVNEAGEDLDTRIEGNTATNLLVCDAGLDAVQIGTTTAGTIADFRSSSIVFNEGSNDMDFRIESDSDANMLFVDASANKIGIGTASPSGKLHIVSDDVTAVKVQSNGEVHCRIEAYGTSSYPEFSTIRGRGSISSPSAIESGDELLVLNGVGQVDSSSARTGAKIEFEATENWGTYSGTRINFSGTDTGSNTYEEWGRFEDGNLSVGGSIKSSSSSSGIGYASGAGGTVTQITSKSTSVTINKICGSITTHNATLNSGIKVSFTVNNSTVSSTDTIILTHKSGGTSQAYAYWIESVSSGSFAITIYNVSASNLGEAITFNFAVIKSVTS